MYMRPAEWLAVVQKEYLQSFIHGGGAAVKFVVPTEEIDHGQLQQELQSIAAAEGYLFARVDAAKTRIHMIDHLFHEVAQQVDWDELAFAFVAKLLSAHGFTLPAQRAEFNPRTLAELNGRDERLLRNELNALLEKSLIYDYQLDQEFRLAMLRLCQAQLDANGLSPVPREAIREWLRGGLRRLAEIKPALISRKVGRDNARDLLSSLSYWSHLTGKSGLVLALDITRCLTQRPRPSDPQDPSRYYTLAMTLDAYEVLRQCIDATDEQEFCFITVIAPPSFLHPDERRGVYSYDALKMRIWDEVRDKRRVNPFSTLIRLSPRPESSSLPAQETAS